MTAVVLAARAGVAVVLLAAGGAKLADLAGFAAAISMFAPRRTPSWLSRRTLAGAVAVAAAETVTGALTLCWPALRWASLAVLVLTAGFVIVAVLGFARHRGRPCRCFGALTRRSFTRRTIAQAVILCAVAVLACLRVPAAAIRLTLSMHLLLLAAAAVLALAARTAAAALAADRAAVPGLAA